MADLSSLARKCPTTGSASGTGTRIALSWNPERSGTATHQASLAGDVSALSCRRPRALYVTHQRRTPTIQLAVDNDYAPNEAHRTARSGRVR
jgi:hypothetical protein